MMVAMTVLGTGGPITAFATTNTNTTSDADGDATCNGLTATTVGTSGSDNLNGTEGPDVIAGLDGHDMIDGVGGDDVICGDEGNDIQEGGWQANNDIMNVVMVRTA